MQSTDKLVIALQQCKHDDIIHVCFVYLFIYFSFDTTTLKKGNSICYATRVYNSLSTVGISFA